MKRNSTKKVTELIIHWTVRNNFVNQELGQSCKHRVGHKPNTMNQTTPIVVQRERLDLKFKKLLTKELKKHPHLIRKDVKATVYIGGTQYHLLVRDCETFSNNLTNCLLKDRHLKKVSMDYILNKTK